MAWMRRRVRHGLRCGAILVGAWLTTASAQEAAPEASPAVPGAASARVPDPAETTPPPDVSTGQYGTSSGITNSDMLIREEDVGSGQAQGDDLFQTPAANAAAGPVHEVQPPEDEAETEQQAQPNAPQGAEDEGRREDGEPQSSNDP